MKKIITLILLIMVAFLFLGCEKKEDKIIKVGASSTPHALILEQAKPYLEKKGYTLEIVVFDDYVLPNMALENGELDANYFQHQPYLDEFNKTNNTHIVSVLKVHFEPLGLYSKTKKEYTTGDKIVVPSDKSNYDRALDLLTYLGIKDAEIVMAEAQYIPTLLDDTDFAVINGNYALSADVIKYCLATESSESEVALRLANIIAVKSGNENTEKTKMLIEALTQSNISKYIADTFGSAVKGIN